MPELFLHDVNDIDDCSVVQSVAGQAVVHILSGFFDEGFRNQKFVIPAVYKNAFLSGRFFATFQMGLIVLCAGNVLVVISSFRLTAFFSACNY